MCVFFNYRNKMSPYEKIDLECETSLDTMYTIFCELNDLRQTATMYDVKVVVGDRIFPCHRNILSSSCKFFKAIFVDTESSKEDEELQNVESDVSEEILNFIYTGKVHITHENVSSLLLCSEYVGLHSLGDLCLACIRNLTRYLFSRFDLALLDTKIHVRKRFGKAGERKRGRGRKKETSNFER